jgi:hypothetical protein
VGYHAVYALTLLRSDGDEIARLKNMLEDKERR